jgi:hypothetical protein
MATVALCFFTKARSSFFRVTSGGKNTANGITDGSRGFDGAKRLLSFNWFPDTWISPFDGIGVQSVQEPRIDREGKFLRKQRVQLRQIMNLWEVDALKDEERFEVFLTTLLSVETDRIPGDIVRSQVILNVQQIMLCFAHP